MLSEEIKDTLPAIIAEIEAYITKTYGEHYAGNEDKVQLIDLWDSEGTLTTMAKCDIQKYAFRLGKKDGFNEKDVFKIIHYAIMALVAQRLSNEVLNEQIRKAMVTKRPAPSFVWPLDDLPDPYYPVVDNTSILPHAGDIRYAKPISASSDATLMNAVAKGLGVSDV